MTTINADPRELAKFSELAHRWWDTGKRFPAAAPDQSAAPRLDRRAGAAAGQARPRRRLRRRHPRRLDGPARRRRARHRPRRQAAQGRPAARDRGGDAARRVPRGRGRGAGRREPGGVRRRHLHGDARARARSRRRSSRPAGGLVKPGGWAFFSTINRNAKAFVFAIVGAEHVLKLLPQGHARVRQVPAPERARRLVPRRVARAGVDARPRIQPADATLSAVGRHQRQLPGRLPQAGMSAAAIR